MDALIEALETLIENEQLWEADGDEIFIALIMATDAKELETSTSKVMKFIHKCLTNDEDSVRVSTSNALRQYNAKFPIDFLMYVITDENDDVRMNAASAIGEHGEDAVGPLTEILEKGIVWHGFREKFNREYHKGEKDLNVWQDIRTSMIEALGYTGSKNAVDILVKIMNENHGFAVYDSNGKKIGFHDSIWHCETAAAEALGQIGDKRAIEPLNKAINSGDLLDSAKMAAALSLGLMDEPNGIKIIVTEYKSEKRSLTEGWNKLKQLPPKKVGKVLEELEL